MKTQALTLLCAGLGLLAGCSDKPSPSVDQAIPQATSPMPPMADSVYFNGKIITINDQKPRAQSVAVRDGRILYVGDMRGSKPFINEQTQQVNLDGKTLLPAFIDAHSHFMFSLNQINQANVANPPVGPATDIASTIAELKKFQAERKVATGGWIVGWGYDQEGLSEARHMTRDDLDPHFPDHKVMLIHVSGHGAILNSQALAWAKVDADTPTPSGGIIARQPDGKTPAGLLMETAYLPVFENLPKPSEAERLQLMKPAQMLYASNGYSHAQEGFSHLPDVAFLRKAAAEGEIFLDIVSLLGFTGFNEWLNNPNYKLGEYNNGLKLQGLKITQDGSPQGRTAFVSEPYLTGGPAGQAHWRGETTVPEKDFDAMVKAAVDNNVQVFVHANGDATIDEVISSLEKAGVKADQDRRTVVIHSQFQRPEHLDKYVELGISPSYFTNHAFFWGDVHVQNIGLEKASFISPMQSANDKGLVTSNHTDFNVTPLDPMLMVWTAVKRETRSGKILGPDQRVSVYDALKALTINPAYQVFEEQQKGSIEVGKQANFVILSDNPMTVDVDNIRDIKVLQTIKQGKTIYPQP